MIVRKKVSGDDRLKEVRLTSAGIALKERIHDEIHLLEDILTAGISEGELDVFWDVLRKMSENISLNKKYSIQKEKTS